jgi:hypothetical protein
VTPVTAPPEIEANPVAVGPEIAANVAGVYNSVKVDDVNVALLLITNVVPFVIDEITVPAGIPVPPVPAPETDIPATNPVVLETVTFFVPLVIDTPEVNLPPAVAAAERRINAE